MKKFIFLAGFLLLFVSAESQPSKAKKVLSFYPQYLIMHGMKAGIEIPLKNNFWLITSPEIYYSENNSSITSYNELFGAGITFHNRKYLLPDHNRLPYISMQASYNYFNIVNPDNDEAPSHNIHKTGLGFTIGIQPELRDPVYLDLYLGVGFRKSFYNTDEDIEMYQEVSWDYAFTGPTLLIGVKLCFITKP
jgi:hypothetical protein